MPGWNLKNRELNNVIISEDEYWSLFIFVFSDACMKRNTYKLGLIKSIMDNLFNCVIEDKDALYRLSYENIFEKFTINYWNWVEWQDGRGYQHDGSFILWTGGGL